MGQEKESSYYDDIFRVSKSYRMNYIEIDRFLIFVRIRQWMLKRETWPVIEIGCGTGQMAAYLEDEGITNYTGVDFSKEALAIARGLSKQKFVQYDVRKGLEEIIKKTTVGEGEKIIVIATEFMEHIGEDIKLLQDLPAGSLFLFSVPCFDDKAHVRFFNNLDEVKSRYENRLKLYTATQVDRIFIVGSTVKEKKKENVVYEG